VERLFLLLAGVNGFLGEALGAFGAHGLRSSLANVPEGMRRLEVWETAARYQLIHAVALGVLGNLAARTGVEGQALSFSGYLFQAGIVLFSGSLYVIALSGIRGFGAITPFGGLCFLAGWVSLIVAVVQR
jgi:uncharacterized membrane protein YgdD (TMEM256/DUF423 family)